MLKKLTGLLVRKPRRASAAPRHDGARLALPEKLPRHVGIIMDGNGRWAQERGLPRSAGHAAGTEALRDIIQACDDWGIYALSIYAFSTENWARPKDEVGALMNLILRYFQSEIDELDEKGAVIRIIGDIDGLPDKQRETVLRAMERTKDNDGLRLNIALNYGGHAELTRAARCGKRALHRRASPGGPAHPHQRRSAHLEFPAVAGSLRGDGLRPHPLAGLHPRGLFARPARVRFPGSPLRRR